MLTFVLDGAIEGNSKKAAIHAHVLDRSNSSVHGIMALSRLSSKLDNKR